MRLVAPLTAWALASLFACSSGDPSQEDGANPGGVGGSGANGGRGIVGGGSAVGGAAGTGTGDAGSFGEGGALVCGNGIVEDEEQCEPGLPLPSCEALGFGQGSVACQPDCRLDDSDCERVERCSDGTDNDQDGDTDCSDTDCEAACDDACESPEPLLTPELENSNLERTSSLRLGCGGSTPGPDVVYSLEVGSSGMLEVSVTSTALLAVAIRTSCGSVASELACGLGGAAAPVEAGDTVFILVQGLEPSDGGVFTLEFRERPTDVCGDGHRDPSEDCDDENLEPGDGCDPECQLEATEREPNQTAERANAHTDPFYARISPEGDVDVVAFDVPEGTNSVFVSTANLADGACAKDELDSIVELMDGEGALIGADDDGGDGLCASLAVAGVPGGSYTARVRAAAEAEPATFPYRLDVFIDPCGDGRRGPLEACDDGNTIAGDGCDPTCGLE